MIYHHPADEKGALIPPKPPGRPRASWGVTLEQELTAASAAMAGAGASAQEIEAFLALLKRDREKGG